MTVIRTYLDHNASSPLRSEARDAMLAASSQTGNPSSVHAEGRAARAVLENARETVAGLFNAKPSQVYFTSGGTEAANWLLRPKGLDQKLYLPPTEHACVLVGHSFEADAVETISVNSDGIVDLRALEARLKRLGGCLVAVQAVNSETGVIQPVTEVAALASAAGAFFVCDAVQAVGKMLLSDLLGANALFFSAHKFGGPKGIGAVVLLDDRFLPKPLLRGGGQERRQRSGTENVVGVAGLAAALNAACAEQGIAERRALVLRSKLETGIRSIAPDAFIFAEGTRRVPNTTSFAIPGLRSELLLMAVDLAGIAISSGSACSSGKVESSHVLEAMGVPRHISEGAIRVSSGWDTKDADIEHFLTALTKICSNRRELRAA